MLAVTLGIKAMGGFPQRLSPEIAAIEHTVAEGRGGCLATFLTTTPDLSPACSAPVAGRPTVALIGDSHASALGPGLVRQAGAAGWGTLIATKSSCAPLAEAAFEKAGVPDFDDRCKAFIASTLDRIVGDSSIRVVVVAGYWDDNATLRVDQAASSLQKLASRLRQAGKRVILVGDVPSWQFDPVHVALASGMPGRNALARAVWRGAEYPDAGVSAPRRSV